MDTTMKFEEGDIKADEKFLYIKKDKIALKRIKFIYVKKYGVFDKVKRSAIISLIFGFVFMLVHPVYVGIPAFIIIFLGAYLISPVYELRIVLPASDETGEQDSGIHKSKHDDVYNRLIDAILA